jgi:archaellum component FlaC
VIERLHQELRDVNRNYETVCTERALVLSRFDQNEHLWKDRISKKQQEIDHLANLHESLKDDHKEVITQLDKYVKRCKQLTD